MNFLNKRCHNLQDLKGASSYLIHVKKLNLVKFIVGVES